jgi:predicted enzyme related to lactoylglutathione lyase
VARLSWSLDHYIMPLPISSVVLYVRDIPKVASFYERYFGYVTMPGALPGWRVLVGPEGGCSIALHKAAKTQKSGAAMKIVFAVPDVASFVAEGAKSGLKFGVVHNADGYCYSNAKDPAGNSISVSDRIFRAKQV